MQYILTEQEYQFLKSDREHRIRMSKENLQALCTKIANEMPVKMSWDESIVDPWGCILDDARNPGYCDECPVQDICPHEHKEWSK